MYKFTFCQPKPSKSNYLFKIQHSFDKRIKEAQKIIKQYPNRIPVVIEKSDRCNLPHLENNKMIVNSQIEIGKFMWILRERLTLKPSEALFLFINNSIIPTVSQTVGQIYDQYADQDQFLYITYTTENTFG